MIDEEPVRSMVFRQAREKAGRKNTYATTTGKENAAGAMRKTEPPQTQACLRIKKRKGNKEAGKEEGIKIR